MPYRAFEAARAQAEAEPIGFTFCGQAYTCRLTPSLGDTFELMEVPEPNPTTLAQSALAIAKFVRRLLATVEDQERWDAQLYDVGEEALVPLVDLGTWLAEQVTGHPSKPPNTSRGGRRTTGRAFKPKSAGVRRSS